MPFELDTLDIHGYEGREVQNSFLKQKKGPGLISVILPGLHYNVDMPLLYYSTGILLEAGHSVLSVDTRYSGKEGFMSVSSEVRTKWMFEDITGVFNAVQELDEYTLAVLVGKSLGTLQMGFLVERAKSIQKCKLIWLTPLLKQEWLVKQVIAHLGESFLVIGTYDEHYNEEILTRITEGSNCEVYTVPMGNHSLDVPGGLVESMNQLTDLMKELRDFVTK